MGYLHQLIKSAASMPVSCPIQTCSVPVHLMTSSFRTETITLPAIFRKTSPTSMDQVLDFWHQAARQKSIYCMSFKKISTQFLNYICKCITESRLDVPKLLEAKIPRQSSAFISKGPEPSLVLIAAFLVSCLSIYWNLTG